MNIINQKPLSVNVCWQGRRFKTNTYKIYEELVKDKLPEELLIPDGQLDLVIDFGLSSTQNDVDNGIKPLVDILQKVYNFNDNRIYGLCVHKSIVPKGEEYSKFEFSEYDHGWWLALCQN